MNSRGEAYRDLVGLDGVGSAVLDSLIDFFEEDHNRDVLARLIYEEKDNPQGVKVQDMSPPIQQGPFAGKNSCFLQEI